MKDQSLAALLETEDHQLQKLNDLVIKSGEEEKLLSDKLITEQMKTMF